MELCSPGLFSVNSIIYKSLVLQKRGCAEWVKVLVTDRVPWHNV